MTRFIRQYETAMCVFTLFSCDDGEFWNCEFKCDNHPVNRQYFKMSGQPPKRN